MQATRSSSGIESRPAHVKLGIKEELNELFTAVKTIVNRSEKICENILLILASSLQHHENYLDQIFNVFKESRLSPSDLEQFVILYGKRLQELSLFKIFERTHLWNLSDEEISLLLENCPNLKSLDISVCCSTINLLNAIALSCTSLESIILMDCYGLHSFEKLAALVQLKNVNFSGCHQLQDTAFIQIIKACRALKYINLDRCEQIADSSISQISELCPHLQELSLIRCDQVTDLSIKALGNSSELQKLQIWGCEKVTAEALKSFVHSSKNKLQFLGLKDIPCATMALIEELEKMAPRLYIESFHCRARLKC